MQHPTPTPPAKPAKRRRARLVRRSARSRGAVIVLALLGAFMMAGMIAYVFNTGRHAQLRQETQSAADATAVSGAGYVARSFNTVAMNNVEISRLIAVVQILDAVPLATEYTLLDVEAYLESVERQQSNGGTGSPLGDQALADVQADLREQQRQLREMNELLNESGYDVREMTFYDGPGGRGELWKAMESLDAISLATMEQLGELAQVTAVETGRRNMFGSDSETISAIAPFTTRFLWQRYELDDFRGPVSRGRLPRWVDDEVTNRGPYDAVFGWWWPEPPPTITDGVDDGVGGVGAPGTSPPQTTDGPGSPWSTGGGPDLPGNNNVQREMGAYRPYGTRQWLLQNYLGEVNNLFDGSLNLLFDDRIRGMSAIKQNYLWPGSASRRWVHFDPQWITDYEQARDIIEAGTPQPKYTQFLRLTYSERFLNGVSTSGESFVDSRIMTRGGGHLEPPGDVDKVRNHVWEDERTIRWETIRYETDAFGNVVEVVDEHRMVIRYEYVWLGMNVGPRIDIRDPNPSGRSDDLPAPIDFDHEQMARPEDGAVGQPGSAFTFLGMAKQPNQASLWRQLYDTSAFDGHAAIAQASVFNNHSWDLWTQMWHAQLEPVQDYDAWVSLMQGSIGDASGYDNLSTGELQELVDYLESLRPLAPMMLNH